MSARILVVAVLVVLGCKREERPAPAAPPAAPAPDPASARQAKELPITSTSAEAVAAFKAGRDLAENYRLPEAAAKFEEALEKDPQFVQARAYLGLATWPAGHAELQKAVASAGALPEAERAAVELIRARSVGDGPAQEKALERLIALVPTDARVRTWHGDYLAPLGRTAETIAAFRQAVQLDPGAASAWNGLGYAYLEEQRFEEAIAAFQRYAQARPAEPNPLDSVGDAQLFAGRWADAEGSYRAALQVSPRFTVSWQGIAVSRALRGDYSGARDALASQVAAAERPVDRVTPRFDAAWTYLTEKRHAEALAELAAAEKEAQSAGVRPHDAVAAALRAFTALDRGQPRQALKELEIAHRRLDAAVGRAPPVAVQTARAYVRRLQTRAWTALGNAAEAEATVRAFEESLDGLEPTPAERNHLAQARGFAALARGDAGAAVAEFERCPKFSFTCRAQLALAAEKAGDEPTAQKAREALLGRSYRSLEYPYVRVRVLGVPPPAATADAAQK